MKVYQRCQMQPCKKAYTRSKMMESHKLAKASWSFFVLADIAENVTTFCSFPNCPKASVTRRTLKKFQVICEDFKINELDLKLVCSNIFYYEFNKTFNSQAHTTLSGLILQLNTASVHHSAELISVLLGKLTLHSPHCFKPKKN